MDALTLAGALERRGVETIPHLTTRDSNLIGLAGDASGRMDHRRGAQRARHYGRSAIAGELSGNFRRITKWIPSAS